MALCCRDAAAQGMTSGAGLGQVPGQPLEAPSFVDSQKQFFKFAAHQGKEERAEDLEKEPGSGRIDRFRDTRHPGRTDTPDSRKLFPITGNPPTTNAQRPEPGQPVPHPFIQRLFTEYSNPMLNHFGPPRYGVPFRVTPEHNPYPYGMNPAAFRDTPYMTGAPPSDLVSHSATLSAWQRTAESLLNPSFQTHQASLQGHLQAAAGGAGDAAANFFECSMNCCTKSLINVANEAAAVPVTGNASSKTLPQVVWMVQQLYKHVYIPMALLLLLPGAVLTQTKSLVAIRYKNTERDQDEDIRHPFTGLLRASIAIALIPAVQLIVSYSIDVGNSMTYEIERIISSGPVIQWGQSQITDDPSMTPHQRQTMLQSESTMDSLKKWGEHTIDFLLNHALTVLIAFQTVMVCYLFLVGPVSAALLAWPGNVGKLFVPVFGNWINALFILVLWRFWWCVIILCMCLRLNWLNNIGQYDPKGSWEGLMYTAFLVMLVYVPFAPFDFRPGDLVDQLLSKAGVK